jgi:hypothetical protein
MKLLEKYLKSVKMYLPREQREDIINELSENLLSKIEDKEAELGRSLTELEQETILREHGEPMVVASRYGSTQRCVSFGRQLIGPALYPIYILVLWLHWGVALIIHVCFAIFDEPLGVIPFIVTVSIQFAAVTLVFTILDFYHRNMWQFRSFHVGYLHPIPRKVTAVGLVFWIIYSAWWISVPFFPSMVSVFVDDLMLASIWPTLYWLILALFLAGVAQRTVNLIRPDWNWLVSPVRLVINVVSLSILFSLPEGYWHLFPLDSMKGAPAIGQPAFTHNPVTWILFVSFLVYWTINACVSAWYCIAYIRYRKRLRQTRASSPE